MSPRQHAPRGFRMSHAHRSAEMCSRIRATTSLRHLEDLGTDASLGLAEAVAQEACTTRLLLPYRHPQVTGEEHVACVSEIHNVACRMGAESIVREGEATKGGFPEQGFNRLQLNWSIGLTTGAADRSGVHRSRAAAIAHRESVSTLKCTSESSQNRPSAGAFCSVSPLSGTDARARQAIRTTTPLLTILTTSDSTRRPRGNLPPTARISEGPSRDSGFAFGAGSKAEYG